MSIPTTSRGKRILVNQFLKKMDDAGLNNGEAAELIGASGDTVGRYRRIAGYVPRSVRLTEALYKEVHDGEGANGDYKGGGVAGMVIHGVAQDPRTTPRLRAMSAINGDSISTILEAMINKAWKEGEYASRVRDLSQALNPKQL